MYLKKLSFVFVFVFVCALALTPFSQPVLTKADGVTYMRVVSDDTPFYADNEGRDVLFYLPDSYYVKVLSQGQNLTHVECFGDGVAPTLDGYVPTQKLVENPLFSGNPYLDFYVTTSDSCILYEDCFLTDHLQYVFSGRKLYYYGVYNQDNQENLYFVFYNGKAGYVKESSVLPFEIPLHPDPMPQEPTPEPPSDTTSTNVNAFDGVRTAIIICLVLAGVIALLLVIKRRSKPSTSAITYYDDNDYE